MIRQCVICGKGFECSPSDTKSTCSKGCLSKRKSQSHRGISNIWSQEARDRLSKKGKTANLKLGTPAAQKSPISGPFETNQNALDWVLRSPEGKIYYCRNLALWARENAELFDRTPTQFVSGIKQIKQYYKGKTKRAVTSYFGWELIDYEEQPD